MISFLLALYSSYAVRISSPLYTSTKLYFWNTLALNREMSKDLLNDSKLNLSSKKFWTNQTLALHSLVNQGAAKYLDFSFRIV